MAILHRNGSYRFILSFSLYLKGRNKNTDFSFTCLLTQCPMGQVEIETPNLTSVAGPQEREPQPVRQGAQEQEAGWKVQAGPGP